MKNDKYEGRKYVLSGIIILIFIVYLSQVFSLQINNSEKYQSLADSNACYKKTVYPARGQMYDRNGKLLVYNKPAYDITFVPREIKGVDTLELCNTLGITIEEFNTRMERVKNRKYNPGYSQYTEQVFMTQIPIEDFAVFQEKNFLFKGFYIRKRYIRQYSHPVAGVLFGIASIMVSHLIWSTILGVVTFSSFWSILEVIHQRERVRKGWFPEGPGHKK